MLNKNLHSDVKFDHRRNIEFAKNFWQINILPTLMKYIAIPNKSPMFDSDWQAHGYMDQAVELVLNWIHQQTLASIACEIVRLPNRTPLLFIEIEGQRDETILLYGHLDKQPEMHGWEEGLAPFKPVLRADKLYGRGSADDGYAAFAAIAAIKSLQQQTILHARLILLLECSEESGSMDLPYYIDHLNARIGQPNLVIGLDSGCGNYEQLWMTTSLRGLVGGVLTINVLTEGVHSGLGSGIVPSTTRILRELLNRIEDPATGDVILEQASVMIPEERLLQAKQAAQVLGESIHRDMPFVAGVKPESNSLSELLLRRTWKAALSIIGSEGLPNNATAGNVTIPSLATKLSLRVPPTADAKKVALSMKKILEENPPYHAQVKFDIQEAANGWHAPIFAPWLAQSADQISQCYYGKCSMYLGEGGSIPFMGMLAEKFPQAQFIITGVLGPHSNAHGPNEFLHLPMATKLTACVAHFIWDHFHREQ